MLWLRWIGVFMIGMMRFLVMLEIVNMLMFVLIFIWLYIVMNIFIGVLFVLVLRLVVVVLIWFVLVVIVVIEFVMFIVRLWWLWKLSFVFGFSVLCIWLICVVMLLGSMWLVELVM